MDSLVATLVAAAGDANGTDADDAQRTAVAAIVADIEARNAVDAAARCDLTSTKWRLLYTDSGGNSSGKIGPFVGDVTQAGAYTRPLFSSTSAPCVGCTPPLLSLSSALFVGEVGCSSDKTAQVELGSGRKLWLQRPKLAQVELRRGRV
jgi:hypothetical protein